MRVLLVPVHVLVLVHVSVCVLLVPMGLMLALESVRVGADRN